MAENAEQTVWPIMDADTRMAVSEVIGLSGSQSETASDSKQDAQDAVAAQVEEAPIVRLANTFLQSAIKEGASEIYIEPHQGIIGARYRIDGVLREVIMMPGYIKQPLTRRFKVLAGVNIVEYRVPQQGFIGTRYDNNVYNLRVDFSPTTYGEKIVMRITNARGPGWMLNQVGLTPEAQAQLESLLWRRGLLVLTGGRGQGRTTTQYVILNRLNTADRNTFAVSD